MTNSEKILRALAAQISKYKSQTKYANEVGVTPQYISQLLKGKNPIGSLSVDMLEKLFPDIVEISFNWEKSTSIRDRLRQFIDSLDEEQQRRALEMLKATFPPKIKDI